MTTRGPEPPQRLDGYWTAGWHRFRDDMTCQCGTSFAQHQATPRDCSVWTPPDELRRAARAST